MIVIIFTLLFSNLIYASDFLGLMNTLEYLNNELNDPISYHNACFIDSLSEHTNDGDDNSQRKPFNACLEDICGDAKEVKSAQEIYDQVTRTFTILTKEQVRIFEQAKEYYRKKIEFQLDIFKRLRESNQK